jgi:4-hydroxy-tetrahydrodipicolinate synthase
MKVSGKQKKHRGVIVPMVTPLTPCLELDEPAMQRLVDHLCEGGVHGIFVLGTTGEGPYVPVKMRSQLVELAVRSARGRIHVYAGISSEALGDSLDAGNRYLKMGVDAVVAHAPAHYEKQPAESLHFFDELAARLNGDLLIYNMPLTTNVSLPIEVCKETARKPRVIGIKDSENNPERMGRLLQELGGRESFSVFVGTGPLMAKGLLQGADGIVPSVGNLMPSLCREFYDSIARQDARKTGALHDRLMELSNVYQKGRTLGQSIAALKGAMTWLGLCGPDVLPPLKPTSADERLVMHELLAQMGMPVHNLHPDEQQTDYRAHDGRPCGSRTRALPADAC